MSFFRKIELNITNIRSNQIKYENTPEQNTFIDKKISEFNKRINKLQTFDIGGFGVAIGLRIVGLVNLPTSLLICVGVFLWRKNDSQIVQDQLNDLVKLYHWSIAEGPKMTHNPIVMSLAKTISPFVQINDVYPEVLHPKGIKLSTEFSDLLLKNHGCLIAYGEAKVKSFSDVFNPDRVKARAYAAAQANLEATKTAYEQKLSNDPVAMCIQVVNEAKSNAQRAIYGKR